MTQRMIFGFWWRETYNLRHDWPKLKYSDIFKYDAHWDINDDGSWDIDVGIGDGDASGCSRLRIILVMILVNEFIAFGDLPLLLYDSFIGRLSFDFDYQVSFTFPIRIYLDLYKMATWYILFHSDTDSFYFHSFGTSFVLCTFLSLLYC